MLNNAIVHGMSILEAFGPKSFMLSLAEIARKTGLPKASVYRILKTFTELNYLKYDDKSKKYYLGPKVLSLGFTALQSMDVHEIARPFLKKLSDECNKTVNLAVLDNHEVVYIDRIRVHDIRDFTISIGTRMPVYNTAVGKAITASLNEPELTALIAQIKSDPAFLRLFGNETRLRKVLDEIRQSGFATGEEEFLKGIIAVAAPLRSQNGVHSAINIVAPSSVASIGELKEQYVPKLIETSEQISELLAGTPS